MRTTIINTCSSPSWHINTCHNNCFLFSEGLIMLNQITSENTALTAVLTYRLIGSPMYIAERYTPTERDKLQSRIDEFRAYQSQDVKGNWLANKYDKDGLVDYMVVSFEKPSNAPFFSIAFSHN